MLLTPNFTLEELTKSSTASRLGINNSPTPEVLQNLKTLALTVLQPIRDAYGKPIVIGSGYRSPKLNKAVGGVSNSDHLYGCAADIKSLSDTPEDNKVLFDVIVNLAKTGKIKCRQILDEYGYDWVHISINNKYNKVKNNEILHI